MEATLDTTGIDTAPPLTAAYWVFFVFILAFFSLLGVLRLAASIFLLEFFITNLFVGALVDCITQPSGLILQTEEQRKWTDLQRNIN